MTGDRARVRGGRKALPEGWHVIDGVAELARHSRRPPLDDRRRGGNWRERSASRRRERMEITRQVREEVARRGLRERELKKRSPSGSRRGRVLRVRRQPYRNLMREIKVFFGCATKEELDARLERAADDFAALRQELEMRVWEEMLEEPLRLAPFGGSWEDGELSL
jgi:hypothetical protein